MTVITSQSLYPVQAFEHRFYHGNRYHCIAAKVTLEWDENGSLSVVKRQPEFVLNDVWRNEESRSSLLIPSDFIPFKPVTDVLVTGTVRPPSGAQEAIWHGALRIGKLEKRLRFYGPRTWQHRALRGWVLSDPEPTSGVSLLYENAYGGNTDPLKDRYEEGEYYPANPIGCGYVGKSRPDKNIIYPAAQIEAWNGEIREFGRNVPPGGFGPVAGHVEDRYRYSGTRDAKWKKDVSPDIPLDMDMRFWNTAPADQQPDHYLKAGEQIELFGVRAGAPLRLSIPKFDAAIVSRFEDRNKVSEDMNLDTVHIDLDTHRVSLRYHVITPFEETLQGINVYCAQIKAPVIQTISTPGGFEHV